MMMMKVEELRDAAQRAAVDYYDALCAGPGSNPLATQEFLALRAAHIAYMRVLNVRALDIQIAGSFQESKLERRRRQMRESNKRRAARARGEEVPALKPGPKKKLDRSLLEGVA